MNARRVYRYYLHYVNLTRCNSTCTVNKGVNCCVKMPMYHIVDKLILWKFIERARLHPNNTIDHSTVLSNRTYELNNIIILISLKITILFAAISHELYLLTFMHKFTTREAFITACLVKQSIAKSGLTSIIRFHEDQTRDKCLMTSSSTWEGRQLNYKSPIDSRNFPVGFFLF